MSRAKSINVFHELQTREADKLAQCYLLMGEGRLFTRPTLVQTVLGSCVAVTMFCPQHCWGGIFHALLPKREDFTRQLTVGDDFRYVDSGIRHLLRRFDRLGVAPQQLECKVFGGGSPLGQALSCSPGDRNAALALELLATAGVPVVASCVGGVQGRKLIFRTDTGVVLQKRFKAAEDPLD